GRAPFVEKVRRTARGCPVARARGESGEMIVRRIGDMHVLTTQVDHARASGQLAHAIDERYCDEQFYHEIIPLITHHDEGWAEWEKNPRRDVSGAPINFMDVDT